VCGEGDRTYLGRSASYSDLGTEGTARCPGRERYWNDAYLDALAEIHRSCGGHGLDAVSVALRWLIHHSQLNAERNDGVIIGASSLEHLRHNLTAVTEGPLPTDVLTAIDDAALKAQPKWPPISTAFRFRSWSEVSHAKGPAEAP
jgi:aryl-alcohol dehydrogenase-like predicted oxidoreductase